MKQHEQSLLFLKKAAEDETLIDEVMTSRRVSDEVIGFHCQQAAEKLLKALLSELGVRFRKTHDLRERMDLLEDVGHPVPSSLVDLDRLTPYGILFRYEDLPSEVSFDRKAADL
jgi:HEPN domain-containing protein